MKRLAFAACAFLLAACGATAPAPKLSPDLPPAPPPPPIAEAAPAPPSIAEAAPPPPSIAEAAPPPSASPAKPAATPAQPPKPPSKPPVAKPAPAPAVAASPAAAPRQAPSPLDLKSLEQRLKETPAIGVLTKLSLKNQVDDLVERFRAFHEGRRPPTLSELRPAFELLVMKVLALLQDRDATLARDIDASREAIWRLLSDRERLSQYL